MVAVDTNILVAFNRTEYSTHERAVDVVTGLAEGETSWGIPWQCIHEFLAVVTNPRIFRVPTPMPDAVEVVDAIVESPSLRLLGEGPDHWATVRRALLDGRVAGARVHDARIAAICMDHRVRCLWTADRDFSRFPALKTHNPLMATKPG
jgi:uncharacterized protein